jgi:hypothetical protein
MRPFGHGQRLTRTVESAALNFTRGFISKKNHQIWEKESPGASNGVRSRLSSRIY